MSILSLFNRFKKHGILLLLGMIVGALLLGAVSASPLSDDGLASQNNESQASSVSLNAPDREHTCTIDNIVTWENRVHVRCTEANFDGMRYFAAPTSDYKHAARILSHLLTAQAMGTQVGINYDPGDNTSGTAYGCLATNCRPIKALWTDTVAP